ncbi:UNVERIFIED_CONTAM: hypothetical protein GTU68_044346, partial [Idotea baltica]|nr:hypothetical protein [Idotea baltica]
MGVKVFTSIRKVYKSKVKLFKTTNEEITSERKEYLEDGELLLPSDFVKYQQCAGKKIKLTLDEVKSMSKVYDSGIELLGFKPSSYFTSDLYVKPANFIYPDDKLIKGSQKLFACLLERCLARKVCPVCEWTCQRRVLRPPGPNLLPQEEVKDEGGCQEKPPGFHICYLPFADDFRNIELENRTRAQSEQVDAAKKMIMKLHFKYHPDCFENPDLQTHWRNVEALALNRPHLEPVKDYTMPDHKGINKKAGRLIEDFASLVLPP